MLKPGDVVIASFVGAAQTKARPALVVSTDLYQSTRADVVVSLVTTRLHEATGPTDYVLHDWAAAGLRAPSAFRVYLNMVLASRVTLIGHLSDLDWHEVQTRLRAALAVT